MSRHLVLRARAVIVVAGLSAAVLSTAVAAQELGLIYVYVMDPSGQPVTDVTAEEFAVVEDDAEASVVSAAIGTAPMKVTLLVDNGIQSDRVINPLRDAAEAFLEALPPQHTVGLFTIGGQIHRRVDYTTDRTELLESSRGIFSDRGAPRFLEGVRENWERRYDDEEPWPVFVAILTDAPESSARMSDRQYNRFVGEIVGAGVMVHAIQLTANRQSSMTNYAIHLAGSTGGRYASVAVATALRQPSRPTWARTTTTSRPATGWSTNGRTRLARASPSASRDRPLACGCSATGVWISFL